MTRRKAESFDVLIIGGGVAGSTLALQLKKRRPDCTICIVERNQTEPDPTTHKVGESMSELGATYLQVKLGLGTYLEEEHLLKIGTRFFMERSTKNEIHQRVELGPVHLTPQTTFHIEKGKFERDLLKMVQKKGVELVHAKVQSVDLGNPHLISIQSEKQEETLQARWAIDASGRSSFLSRKLDLRAGLDHHINSVWFRTSARIRVHEWTEDPKWTGHIGHSVREWSTNHLLGKGYWVWQIPLPSGGTSIGIVADPRYHPLDEFNSLEKALEWISDYEPQLHQELNTQPGRILDFKQMKDFAFNSKQYYSSDRWALTGDACCFLDPLYSPGMDLIALGNTWITELITRDLNDEPIELRTQVYETTHRKMFEGWLKLYQDAYPIFGSPKVAMLKIAWDWATYWAVPNVMFMNDGYTDLQTIKEFSSMDRRIGLRFEALNEQIQANFKKWAHMDEFKDRSGFYNIFGAKLLLRLQDELRNTYEGSALIDKIEENVTALELLADGMIECWANNGDSAVSGNGLSKERAAIMKDVHHLWLN